MDDGQLFDEVHEALERFRRRGLRDFTDVQLAQEIEAATGPLPAGAGPKIRQLLVKLWGSGIEPKTIGAGNMEGGRWGFGRGKPPQSREIRPG